jgi:hypothetical protein
MARNRLLLDMSRRFTPAVLLHCAGGTFTIAAALGFDHQPASASADFANYRRP